MERFALFSLNIFGGASLPEEVLKSFTINLKEILEVLREDFEIPEFSSVEFEGDGEIFSIRLLNEEVIVKELTVLITVESDLKTLLSKAPKERDLIAFTGILFQAGTKKLYRMLVIYFKADEIDNADEIFASIEDYLINEFADFMLMPLLPLIRSWTFAEIRDKIAKIVEQLDGIMRLFDRMTKALESFNESFRALADQQRNLINLMRTISNVQFRIGKDMSILLEKLSRLIGTMEKGCRYQASLRRGDAF